VSELLDAFLDEDAILLQPSGQSRKELWMAIRMDAPPPVQVGLDQPLIGDGSQASPFCGNTPEQFDYILRTKADPNTIIHLGPGIFRTRGYSPNAGLGGWIAQPGQKLVGSSMFATILRFVWTAPLAAQTEEHWIVSHDFTAFLTDFEISDLCLDCALETFAPSRLIATAGLAVFGDHMLMKRVRIINFGTRTAGIIDGIGPYGYECFPVRIGGISTSGQQSFNAVIEDCIIEQPYTGTVTAQKVCKGSEKFAKGSASLLLGLLRKGSRIRCALGAERPHGSRAAE
jgi:hypothetical protein